MNKEADGQGKSRTEYLGRIHRVMDYIERNLERPFTLEELAGVACFSPFHFHRVFTACAGETLYQFILRLRLERAADQLVRVPGKSVTAVALDLGFGSSAAFARAFHAAFGTSATEWRDRHRKDCEAISKNRQDPQRPDAYAPAMADAMGADGPSGWRAFMSKQATIPPRPADAVRIETIEPMTVAYVRHVGPYAGDTQLFGRLFGRLGQWAGPRGLLGPQAKWLTIYHDNPEITEEQKLRISVCVTVPPGTHPEGDIGVMTIDAGKYAAARFEIDASEFGAIWNWLMGVWLPSSGYQPDDRPCFEMYLNNWEEHPQKKHIVEIWEPVKPL